MTINTQITKFVGRIVAGSFYDMQEIRIATKNRIRDVIRKKVDGVPFDAVEEKKEEKTYGKKYTDKELLELWEKLKNEKKISQKEFDYVMECWTLAKESEKVERKYEKAMLTFVSNEDVYTKFLEKIRGIGAVLSANLIKEFGDCSQYDTPAKLWAHCGQSVIGGVAPRKVKGQTISYNPRLRTLVWKISDCLLKSNKGIYRQIYDTTKQDYAGRKYKKGELEAKYGKPYKKSDTKLSKGHAHNIALRKMRKIFLANYWECAREVAGLQVREPFVKEKLHHKHIITWRDAVKHEQSARMP